jgi:hypothetical protein
VRRTAEPKERLPILAGVLAVFVAVAAWEHANGQLSWLWAAGIFGSAYALVAAAVVRGEVSAGANWVRRVAPFGTAWVRTDRLVEASVDGELTGPRVTFRDLDGRRVHARIEEFAEAPEVWRPLYAAVRTSLEGGQLRADPSARVALGLPLESA